MRLVKGTKSNVGQSLRYEENVQGIYIGDSCFSGLKTARLVAEYWDIKLIGPVKKKKAGYPISTLGITIKELMGDTYLVLETVSEVTPLVAIWYK